MKKLVTVCWSNAVEVEIPDDAPMPDGIWDALHLGGELEHIGDSAICEAYENISAKCGQITDIQDA